ncbi:MAG: S8/S53 family peptidase [Gammaproteobacteria bacterium]|nr:S8/S53 family peptidase [Gammaproteobacteria bacterium]
MTIRSLFAISALGLLLAITAAHAREWTPARLLAFTDDSCRAWEKTTAPAPGYASAEISVSDLRFGEIVVGKRYRLPLVNNALVELDVVERAQRPVRFVASWYHQSGDPLMLIALASDCSFQAARRLNYNRQNLQANLQGQALNIVSLDENLEVLGEPDWLNPPLQFVERAAPTSLRHPGATTPLRVAMVDSGVNYRLAEINRRLARDAGGQLIGYDFWEMDALPYDSHPVNSGFFVQRHGTRSASLLLREAPDIELVPYRYPRPDMSRMQALVEHADANDVAIMGMPLGSNRAEDWGSFARAASAHPRMLFIVSAGNDGRDIDTLPVFPAALGLENILVVTSADDYVRPAERSNWGRLSVDFMVPAERRNALDYSGGEALVSGSSYAVSRVAALAARLKSMHRDWMAVEIIDALHQRYGQGGPDVYDWVGGGYIADPLASSLIDKTVLTDFEPMLETAATGFRLDLEVLQLDPKWSVTRIGKALHEAYRILAQCGIVPGDVSSYAIRADDYLLDLSTGSARSLLEATAARQPTVVFARETRMEQAYLGEAFGIGNTERRPWLANSVWLMLDVDDAGIALAHELYHVLANSGAHVEDRPSLMQRDTRPESTELTLRQCRLAQRSGVKLGLLKRE